MRTFIAACLLAASAARLAQAYPSVPCVSSRIPARRRGRCDHAHYKRWAAGSLGQPVVVENRSGAGGTVGADAAARAPADGYTLLSGGIATHAIAPALYSKLGYDAVRDFAPLSMIGITPNVLIVNPSLQVRSVAEFIALAKAAQRKLDYARPASAPRRS